LEACLGGAEGLEAALLRLRRQAAEAPAGVLVLTDRLAGPGRPPIPMALAVGAVHEGLVALGQRTQKDIVAVAGDVVEVHDLAMLITAGASAVHPYLALATAMEAAESAAQGEDSCRQAFEAGLTKVMAKMGISTVQGYCGARVLEAVGLGADVMAMCFPSAPSRMGGACLADLEAGLRARSREAAAAPDGPLPDHGRVRFRRAGEWHAHNPVAVRALQRASASGMGQDWDEYRSLAAAPTPVSIRDLLAIRAGRPVPLPEVEPAAAIVTRFVATAMSLGSLSPEAHQALALAMNRIGARSNSGEGGEDPELYGAPERRDSKVKQVASARFGVTRDYLRRAEEIEIKIAQGSKPGEGGQLPGAKVTELIARLRHAQPGTQLISPPPHHDIYSIEDLAQLIHDLKAANPAARVGVKLVAESGVGTIAAGVAKAGADYILISGHEGGTGASPLGSIKNAGVPWEIGLAEAQRVLAASRFRDRVRLRVDGGLRTGRDVVVAALLGAEEFGFGTSLLVALGCDMARQCHLNTCPTGIATQDAELRAKFAGTTEMVINFFTFLAVEIREIL
ncbi:MAG: glutamate synthase-related protein, partial [Candidatus Dormibacterales bacterium]